MPDKSLITKDTTQPGFDQVAGPDSKRLEQEYERDQASCQAFEAKLRELWSMTCFHLQPSEDASVAVDGSWGGGGGGGGVSRSSKRASDPEEDDDGWSFIDREIARRKRRRLLRRDEEIERYKLMLAQVRLLRLGTLLNEELTRTDI
jgi:hypothetical protein